MKPKLTIVTTTYNQEKFIEQTLDGFVMQKVNFPFQAIISDDCSTDSTRKILKKYAKKYPEIIKPVFNKKNVGPMDNFVNTLSLVNSEYVALCDGDDFWTDENKLQKQVDFLDKNKDFSICFHQTKIFFEDGSKEDEIYPKNIKNETTFEDLLKDSYIPANTVVYRWIFTKKTKLKDIFPKNIVPGDYYVHLLHARKGKIGFIEEIMSNYRRHDGGMWWLTSQKSGEEKFYLKYGLKYINFFEAIENEFSISKDIYDYKKRYLAHSLLKYYLINNMFENIVEFKNTHKYLYDICISDFKYDVTYEKLGRFKKFIYLLLIDRKKLLQKIKDKLKNNK